ncbi:MAG: sensor histidine kinase [Bacteroidota bacterium]
MGETEAVFTLSLIGLIVMLLLALAVVLFYVYYQRRLLEQQQKMGYMRETQQQQLLAATIQSQEEERKRIATDLHDSVGILLTTSQLFIRQIPELPETVEHRKTSLDLIDNTLANVRAITNNLAPENLFNFGLTAAVEDLVKTTNQLDGLSVHFTNDVAERLPAEQESAVYRIVQELFTNSIKHAKASRIDVELRLQPKRKALLYRDDGVGMNLPTKQNKLSKDGHGYGLKNIESRARMLNGELALQSQPGKGFFMELSF